MQKIQWLFYFLSLTTAVGLQAAGPENIGKSDRGLWPEQLDSILSFDRASRAEILVFANALDRLSHLSETDLKAELHIKSVDNASVRRVHDRLGAILLKNYQTASTACDQKELFCEKADSLTLLTQAATRLDSGLPSTYRPWLDNSQAFHRQYAAELIRLAALFPTVSSEIDAYSPDERTGFEMADRHFLLTFDDGPSGVGGHTDTLLETLKHQQLHAMFYLLGERLQARSKTEPADVLRKRYEGQCLALHGWQHQSHQKWGDWQKSVLDTQQLVKHVFADGYRPYFRPPYGQRRADSADFFTQHALHVALWNIDSQDWNAKVSGRDVAQRVASLMLLWRRGVILFHDIHPKSTQAIPWLLNEFARSGINWDSCQNY